MPFFPLFITYLWNMNQYFYSHLLKIYNVIPYKICIALRIDRLYVLFNNACYIYHFMMNYCLIKHFINFPARTYDLFRYVFTPTCEATNSENWNMKCLQNFKEQKLYFLIVLLSRFNLILTHWSIYLFRKWVQN